jgi:hypothetical protein
MKTFGKIAIAFLAPWTSRKLWMTVVALVILHSLFWTSVWYLYSFAEQWRAEIFYRMFNSTMWATTMAVLGYLGLQTLAQGWTQTTTSAISSVTQNLFSREEKRLEVEVDEKLVKQFQEKYRDDPSYRPIETVPDMEAPDFK